MTGVIYRIYFEMAMKHRIGFILVCLLLAACQSVTPKNSVAPTTATPATTAVSARSTASPARPDPRTMTFPPQAFQPPKPDRIVLENGLVLFLLEDRELPLISVSGMVRTGSLYEPAEKIGLAGLTGAVLRTGGTTTRTGDEIDIWVDQVAAELGASIGLDAGGASLDILKKDFDAGLALLADMLIRPVFDAKKIEVARAAALEGIRRRNDRPAAVVSRVFNKQIYGAKNPYGREATEATVAAITRSDMVAFHQKYFAPNNTMIALSGDFDRAEMVEKIKQQFGAWPRREVAFPAVAEAVDPTAGVYIVSMPIVQTQVRMGHLSIRQDDPDYFALSIMDDLLGAGGFASRIFDEVRTKRGLAYAAGSVLRPGNFDRGLFMAYGETRSATTHQMIEATIGQIKKMREAKVTQDELERTRAGFLNSLIFSFAQSGRIVERRMSLEYYGLPEDFLERFRDGVAKVTADDILRVAQTHLHPDQMVILAVGDPAKFDQPLSTFGPITELPLTP